jgi:hypothetical protein
VHPFEEPELYQLRTIRDRLPVQALNRYCARLGIIRHDPDAFRPDACLVSADTSKWPKASRTMRRDEWLRHSS